MVPIFHGAFLLVPIYKVPIQGCLFIMVLKYKVPFYNVITLIILQTEFVHTYLHPESKARITHKFRSRISFLKILPGISEEKEEKYSLGRSSIRIQLNSIQNSSGKPNHQATDNWEIKLPDNCLLYTSPSPRDLSTSRMPSSA